MYRKISDFLRDWQYESDSTLKVFEQLTDQALPQRVTPQGRTLGRLAWHLVLTLGEMPHRAGLPVPVRDDQDPTPAAAREIAEQYHLGAQAVADQVKANWTDDRLTEKVLMYGEEWSLGVVLSVLIRHQAHHRGQMTVLMRQAGLKVPGVYGPASEEWAAMGLPAMT